MRAYPGRVYVMEMAEPGIVKVGRSTSPEQRLKGLKSAKAVRLLHKSQKFEDAHVIEQTAHRLLALSGRHVRGETFRASVKEAIAAIKRAERIAAGQELALDRAGKYSPKKPRQPRWIDIRVMIDAGLVREIKAIQAAQPIRCTFASVVRAALMTYVEHMKEQFPEEAAA